MIRLSYLGTGENRAGYYLCWGCLTWVQVRTALDTTSAGAVLLGYKENRAGYYLCWGCLTWIQGEQGWILPLLGLSYLDTGRTGLDTTSAGAVLVGYRENRVDTY